MSDNARKDRQYIIIETLGGKADLTSFQACIEKLTCLN